MDTLTAHAMIRFGLGRRGQEALPSNPVAWLQNQVECEDPATFDAQMPNTADGLTLLREQYRLNIGAGGLVAPVFQRDVKAQTELLLTTEAPFRERLVLFWANHFTVSTRQGGTDASVGPYVREAIRPHVNGPFFAMLLAVMRHPAMLMYLDNNASIGPDSVAGKQQKRGLNENLARECLELHTLGVNGGYSQADVTEFAKIISGWSVELNRLFPGYQFRDGSHQPGSKTLLGKRFPSGEAGGIAALEFLAHHPATYRHLATKLVTHFVADVPPPEAVHAIELVLRETDGDLGKASVALLHLEQAWTPLSKLRSPLDYSVATLRALDLVGDKVPLRPVLGTLGQPVWTAPLPNGWSDQGAEWAAPEALMRRIDWSYEVAAKVPDHDAMAVAEASLGPLLQPRTGEAIRRAGSRRDALTLLLTSPEFQRR